jgi:hypothetical protein
MKKLAVFVTFLLAVGLSAGVSLAAPTNLNELGSVLVYPLIDNRNYETIIEVANEGLADVWVAGYMIVHADDPTSFTKSDFKFKLTPKEVFWWRTSQAIPARGLQSFANRKGFLFLWAVDNNLSQLEIDWDFLKGDALVFGGGQAFQYNAIPHQGLAVVGDRVLNLDNVEYTESTRRIYFEGFASGFAGITGTLAVAGMDIDFLQSKQPADDINFTCWNENEQEKSIHKDFYQFVQYSLLDLELALGQVFTPKFHCQATATNIPLWAVFFQQTGALLWGSNVWHDPARIAPTAVVLPEVVQ